MRDYSSRRPIDLIQERAKTVKPSGKPPDLEMPVAGVRFSKLTQTPAEGGHIEAVEVRAAAEVWVPAWIVAPSKSERGEPSGPVDPR